MKKLIAIVAMFVFAIPGVVSAQGKVSLQDIHITTKVTEGQNSVPVPDFRGTLKFVKRGDKFFDVFFTDATGKSFRLIPSKPGSGGTPKPTCEYPIPDACFATADKNIGMCMCKPTNISNGEVVTAGAHYKTVVIEMRRGGE